MSSSSSSSSSSFSAAFEMGNRCRVACCNLNQWAMDFDHNVKNVALSIQVARAAKCTFRSGPELELCGYSCEDHFFELDTILHCWESLLELLPLTDGILCDIGMPVLHRSVRYNCRVFLYDRQIVLIRPKIFLANEGNYREQRWFTPWRKTELESCELPPFVQKITNQRTVPIGNAIIRATDVAITSESCEELFTPDSPHIGLFLNGVDIIANGSGSHHQLRKLDQRLQLILGATAKSGGCYMYSNQIGCDGNRLYFDGCSCVAVNGELKVQASQFAMREIEVAVCDVDLDSIRAFRGSISSRSQQASYAHAVPSIMLDAKLTTSGPQSPAEAADRLSRVEQKFSNVSLTHPNKSERLRVHSPQEEIARGPACWLWDYLRRSGASGFFLPLSGGADSAATAAIVGNMCQMVMQECASGNQIVQRDVLRITASNQLPASPQALAKRIFYTCYMATRNSGDTTTNFASQLAEEIGATHRYVGIDSVCDAVLDVFCEGNEEKIPRFKTQGGSSTENLALQNIQARSRMTMAYVMAGLSLWREGRQGFLLVLGSANVDEALRGYMTKYDCSAADLNPIGGISKVDLGLFLDWGVDNLGYATLRAIRQQPPTAELEPQSVEYKQTDEVDMGMSYEELSWFGKLRKLEHMGPVSMFLRLSRVWEGVTAVEKIAEKVKHFFKYYAINRHKATVLTPSYHAENYSPDDNRFDLRQFLYNFRWPRQFRDMDKLVERSNKRKIGPPNTDEDDAEESKEEQVPPHQRKKRKANAKL